MKECQTEGVEVKSLDSNDLCFRFSDEPNSAQCEGLHN